MASKRMIASDIFEDEFYAGLTLLGRELWVGLIVRDADDQGRLQDNCELMKSHIFPYDHISPDDLAPILCEFEKAGKILRYVFNGKHLIQILNWWRYQTLTWANASKYPAPPGWTDRIKMHQPGVANKVMTVNWDAKGGFDGATQATTQPATQGVSTPTVKLSIDELTRGLTPEGNQNPETKGGGDMPYRDPVWDLLHGETPEEPQAHGPDVEWATEETRELAFEFLTSSRLPPPRSDSDKKYWIKSLQEMAREGITGELMRAAVVRMRSENLTIKAPGSVQAVAYDLKAKGVNGKGRNRLLPEGV